MGGEAGVLRAGSAVGGPRERHHYTRVRNDHIPWQVIVQYYDCSVSLSPAVTKVTYLNVPFKGRRTLAS